MRLEFQEDEWTGEKLFLPATFRVESSTQGLPHDQDHCIGDQDQSHHFLHQATTLIQQLMEVEQAFQPTYEYERRNSHG